MALRHAALPGLACLRTSSLQVLCCWWCVTVLAGVLLLQGGCQETAYCTLLGIGLAACWDSFLAMQFFEAVLYDGGTGLDSWGQIRMSRDRLAIPKNKNRRVC